MTEKGLVPRVSFFLFSTPYFSRKNSPGAAVNGLYLALSYTFDR